VGYPVKSTVNFPEDLEDWSVERVRVVLLQYAKRDMDSIKGVSQRKVTKIESRKEAKVGL